MNPLGDDKTCQSAQPGLFNPLTRAATERPHISPEQQIRDLERLLDAWQLVHVHNQQPEGDSSQNLELVIDDARDALERGLTPYEIMLLVIAPWFSSARDRELEVLGEA